MFCDVTAESVGGIGTLYDITEGMFLQVKSHVSLSLEEEHWHRALRA